MGKLSRKRAGFVINNEEFALGDVILLVIHGCLQISGQTKSPGVGNRGGDGKMFLALIPLVRLMG